MAQLLNRTYLKGECLGPDSRAAPLPLNPLLRVAEVLAMLYFGCGWTAVGRGPHQAPYAGFGSQSSLFYLLKISSHPHT